MGMFNSYAAFAGHSTLRAVVGVPVSKPANQQQTAQMVQLVEQEMEAGALGVSYGPFYVPATSYSEMLATATKCAELGGGGSIHIRYAFFYKVDAIKEAIQLATESDIPLLISHMGGSSMGAGTLGTTAELMAKAPQDGVRLASDVFTHDCFAVAMKSYWVAMLPPEQWLIILGIPIENILVGSTVVIDGTVYMEAFQSFESVDQFKFVRDLVFAGFIPYDPGPWIGRDGLGLLDEEDW